MLQIFGGIQHFAGLKRRFSKTGATALLQRGRFPLPMANLSSKQNAGFVLHGTAPVGARSAVLPPLTSGANDGVVTRCTGALSGVHRLQLNPIRVRNRIGVVPDKPCRGPETNESNGPEQA